MILLKEKKSKKNGAVFIFLLVLALCAGGIYYFYTRGAFESRPSAEELLCDAVGLTDDLRDSAQYNESDALRLLILENVKFDVHSYTKDEISVTVTSPDLAGITDELLERDITAQEMLDELRDIIDSGDYPKTDRKVTVAVGEDKLGWYAEPSKELLDAVWGGLISYGENLQ